MPRSILTEKLARRGMHVAREYSVHPLELIAVEQVMAPREDLIVLQSESSAAEAAERIRELDPDVQHLEYPVVDRSGELQGFVSHAAILQRGRAATADQRIGAVTRRALTVHPGDRVRAAASVMATGGRRSVAVVDDGGAWIGVLTTEDLLKAWKRGLSTETRRVRVRSLRRLALFSPRS